MTESTTLVRNDDGTFTVTGAGGYDGYLLRDFDDLDKALGFLVSLWQY
jgi:hypothetical protein